VRVCVRAYVCVYVCIGVCVYVCVHRRVRAEGNRLCVPDLLTLYRVLCISVPLNVDRRSQVVHSCTAWMSAVTSAHAAWMSAVTSAHAG